MDGRRRNLRLGLRLRRQWSELQRDMLQLILKKLDLADHARFASVCSSWRSVAAENPPINKPLYMALSQRPNHLIRRFVTSFVPNWKTARFIGAGLDGWAVILIDDKDLFLVNKGFNSITPLPLPISRYSFENAKAVLSSPSLSSSSSVKCTVVINRTYVGVFYFRLGSDKSFTKLSNILYNGAKDILFFNEQLYVLCYRGTVIIFDHLLNKISQLDDAPTFHVPYDSRLLILGNKILVVAWTQGTNEHLIYTFEGSNPAKVVRLSDIGDNLLLLDNRHFSLSVSTKEHKEFRRTNYYEGDFGTSVILDTDKDPNKTEFHDPWPLFFLMFNHYGIKDNVV